MNTQILGILTAVSVVYLCQNRYKFRLVALAIAGFRIHVKISFTHFI